jgi:tetratricopeptide (TPR) repeat protein
MYKLHAEIGAAYYKMGNLDKAIENYQAYIEGEKAAGVTTPTVQVRATLAGIYLEKDDVASAKKYLDGIDESAIKDPSVFYNLGVSYANAKDNDSAIKYFEKSVAADPKFVDGYYQLAVTYVAKNDTAKAVAAFKKVIELAPNSDSAKEAQDYINLMESK